VKNKITCLRRAALYPAELRAHWSYAGLDSGSPPAQQRPRLPLATVAPIGWADERRSDAMAQLAEKREGIHALILGRAQTGIQAFM